MIKELKEEIIKQLNSVGYYKIIIKEDKKKEVNNLINELEKEYKLYLSEGITYNLEEDEITITIYNRDKLIIK